MKLLSRITTIIAIRHGETEWNCLGRQQGHLDSPLTALGRQQALAMANALVSRSIHAIYSSDLGRARETADIIANRLELPVLIDARLRERNLGVLEGHTLASFAEEYPTDARAFESGDPDYVLPGGESARQRSDRNISFVDAVVAAQPGQTILLVGHGGVLNSFFRRAVGLPLDVARQFSLLNAAINTFTVAGSEWRLVTWGETSHLHGISTLDDK